MGLVEQAGGAFLALIALAVGYLAGSTLWAALAVAAVGMFGFVPAMVIVASPAAGVVVGLAAARWAWVNR